MIRAGQGLHAAESARKAASKAAADALREVSGAGKPDLVLVFATENYDPSDVLGAVHDVVGDVPLAGCRAPGVLACGQVTHDGVGVFVVAGGQQLVARAAGAERVGSDPRGAGARAAEAAIGGLEAAAGSTPYDKKVVVVLPDAITGNSCEVVRGLDSAVGSSVRVTGGGAGDDLHFKQTFQFVNDAALSDGVAAIAIGSSSPVGLALRHGCSAWGPPMTVTRASGRTLHELDWARAFDRYVDVAGRRKHDISRENFVEFAMRHPFGIPQGTNCYVLRSPLQLDGDGGIACCADLPVDGVLRVMAGDENSLLAASREAAAIAADQLGGQQPSAALVFACISRDLLVGGGAETVSKEIAAVREGLAVDVPVFGCLTFGQIGAMHGGAPQFNSKSIAVCALPSA